MGKDVEVKRLVKQVTKINNKLLFVENPSRPSKILLANGDDNFAVSVFKPLELFSTTYSKHAYLIDSVLEVKVKQLNSQPQL